MMTAMANKQRPRTRRTEPADRGASLRLRLLDADPDGALDGTSDTAERQAVLDEYSRLLARVPTSYLIAWLPVLAGHAASVSEVPPNTLRVHGLPANRAAVARCDGSGGLGTRQ
jgi:hypothetical protein